jgi:hypothetical protein
MKIKTAVLMALVAAIVGLGGPALAQDAGTPDKDQVVQQPKPYSPYVDQNFPQKVLFGDTHFHSSLSVDSGLIGNTLPLETAIRFAMGEEVRTNGGQRAKLIRPLDFLVLSDHAEYLGIADLLAKGDPALLANPVGKGWYEAKQKGGDAAWQVALGMMDDFASGNPKYKDDKVMRSVWDGVVDIASKYNTPGAFTVLNGYEWSSTTNGDNLHRVVVFRDGPDRVKQILPFSAFDSVDPDLDPAQQQPQQRRHVRGDRQRPAHDQGLCRAPRSLGTSDGGHPGERYQRGAPSAFPEGRVRGFRDLGHGQYAWDSQYTRYVSIRICPFGAQDRDPAGGRAWRQSLQVRDDRKHRYSQLAHHRSRRQLFRQASE